MVVSFKIEEIYLDTSFGNVFRLCKLRIEVYGFLEFEVPFFVAGALDSFMYGFLYCIYWIVAIRILFYKITSWIRQICSAQCNFFMTDFSRHFLSHDSRDLAGAVNNVVIHGTNRSTRHQRRSVYIHETRIMANYKICISLCNLQTKSDKIFPCFHKSSNPVV